tara:strand:- start:126 stop:320 length:195 start_codon:yes stop_codon:yes gene_type:complete
MTKLSIYHLQDWTLDELNELAEELHLECEVHLGVAREALYSYDEPYEVLRRVSMERKAREVLGS